MRSSQAAAPDSRVVYVDNDPLVLAHARALLTSSPEGATAYLDADLRDTGHDPRARRPAPWTSASRSRIMLIAILHYIPDLAEARRIVARLTRRRPAGQLPGHLARRAPTCCPTTIAAFEKSLNAHLPGRAPPRRAPARR